MSCQIGDGLEAAHQTSTPFHDTYASLYNKVGWVQVPMGESSVVKRLNEKSNLAKQVPTFKLRIPFHTPHKVW